MTNPLPRSAPDATTPPAPHSAGASRPAATGATQERPSAAPSAADLPGGTGHSAARATADATAADWLDIGPLDAIPVRGSRKVTTPLGCVAVFRTGDDRVFALNNRCPHKGGPLSEGIVHGHAVTCPLHNWVFDLATGLAQGADEGRVETFPARVESGRILLDATRLRQRPEAA